MSMRFSGHESFAFRYAWLPKAYQLLAGDPNGLADDESAMVALGIGKNMVQSLRFWAEATGLAVSNGGRSYELTPFAHAVFGEDGHDPYLEDTRTLWLLHWNVSTQAENAIFAWRFLLNQWPYSELAKTEVVDAFSRESDRLGHSHSLVTLGQHFDVFLHTYISTRGNAKIGVGEDSLDGPLVELGFLQHVGDRSAGGSGKREAVYAFRREPKAEITRQLFEYCLNDYWQQWHLAEATLRFRDVSVGVCSPGQVFKLPEEDVRERLELYAVAGLDLPFSYQSSAVQGLLSRTPQANGVNFLAAVYEEQLQDA